jgi:D-alanyl-D-alanine carboxypeptidase/D-alanyl-D-alanine-endopeptidase (penicillin-binding protein 4)
MGIRISVGFALTTFDPVLQQFVNDPQLGNASIGFCVIDLSTGAKIASNAPQTALPPASTTKLFASAAAFELAGANYKPKTRIYATRALDKKGVLQGDLWIRGGGDVSLGSKYYNAEENQSNFLKAWADTLYVLGLRKIEGSVIGDASEFGYQGAPDGWNWADMGNYYGAGPSGLSIYDNMLRYYFKVGGTAGSKTTLLKTFPYLADFNFNNYILAGKVSGDNSYVYGAPYSMDRFGTGFLPLNSASFVVKGSLPDPELQFAAELQAALIAKGIEISGQPKGVRNLDLGPASKRYTSAYALMYTHEGPTVSSIAYWTNMKSVNVFAETLLCWAGYVKNGDGSTENALTQAEKYWRSKFPIEGLYLKDGSGLSRSNAISPQHFCDLLQYMHTSKNAEAFKATLPVAGESGTLAGLCKGQAAQGKVRAKSGTMSRIKAYAGYVECTSGRQLAFAVIVNNYNCTNDAMMTKIEKLLNALVVL